jgi:outer membrane protein OmpA-like peptidoglycan-associated protein
MKTTQLRQHSILASALIALQLCFLLPATANESETKRIIEALKPEEGSKVKTRGLRNLQVEQTGQDASAAQKFVSLTIGFKFNSAEISPESAETLGSLAKALKSDQLATLEFMIEGHTDGKGTPDYNMKLSNQRAASVKTYLEKQGVAAKRIRSQGKGDTELANVDDRFAAENRRVKIITLNP